MSNINPIQDGRTAQVDNNGVLNCLVQQPVDNTPSEVRTGTSTSTLKYVEKFKGPYNKLKDILSYIKIGQTISDQPLNIPSGTNTLHVLVQDEDGKQITYEKQYEIESNINFEVSGNKIKITYQGDTLVSYMT